MQINPDPVGDQTHFMATVTATRYGFPLDAVGFHNFNLEGGEESLKHRAAELYPILGRQNFKNKKWRKRLLSGYHKWMAEHGHGIGWPSRACKLCANE